MENKQLTKEEVKKLALKELSEAMRDVYYRGNIDDDTSGREVLRQLIEAVENRT